MPFALPAWIYFALRLCSKSLYIGIEILISLICLMLSFGEGRQSLRYQTDRSIDLCVIVLMSFRAINLALCALFSLISLVNIASHCRISCGDWNHPGISPILLNLCPGVAC